jgi:hypothetical protein
MVLHDDVCRSRFSAIHWLSVIISHWGLADNHITLGQGITADESWAFSVLAQGILYDKFFATPYKNAYMAGDFPSHLVWLLLACFFTIEWPEPSRNLLSANRLLQVNNFIALAEGKPSSEENRPLNAYFCHREVSYGVSEMMGVWQIGGGRIGIAQR